MDKDEKSVLNEPVSFLAFETEMLRKEAEIRRLHIDLLISIIAGVVVFAIEHFT